MRRMTRPPFKPMQQGFVSVIVLLFLIAFVLFVLMQTLSLSGSKSLDAQQSLDSVAALALADSGREIAVGSITDAVNTNDAVFSSQCSSFNSGSPTALGRGTFQYVPSTTPATNSLCPIRVTGTVNSANQTIEAWMNFSDVIGTANWGTAPTMTLNNPYNTPAVALFDLAWRIHGSATHGNGGGNSTASPCTLPSCVAQWNNQSSNGSPSVGSLGTTVAVGAKGSATVVQTISRSMDYVEVGMMFGGLTVLPSIIGNFATGNGADTGTTNNSNSTVSTGTTTSGEANSWCQGADTLAFGISGRGPDGGPPYDYTGSFASIAFNSTGTPAQPINLTWVSHYPNTDGSSPNSWGDVFAEVWYTYNPYFKLTNTNSAGKSVTVSSTTGLKAGTILKVYSGTGALPGSTTIASITDATHFVLSNTPTTALVNATLCGGICALFDNPSSATATTTFQVTRNTSAAQQWASGFVCLSGVDPTKIRRIATSSLSIQQWHQVVNGE
jgi:hypothetical protein